MPLALELKQLDIELWKLLFVKGSKVHVFAGPSIDVKHEYLEVNTNAPSNIPLCGLLAATPLHLDTSLENWFALENMYFISTTLNTSQVDNDVLNLLA
jgi:hypothetical protein